jgi:purine-binding chemotaxis protein CheW
LSTPDANQKALTEKELQVVGFRVGDETFGVPIAHVREIIRVPQITALPNAPEYVEGVINLRGKIISVIDLRKRFGEANPQPGRKNRILVVELHHHVVGLIVDSASEVLKLPPSEIEPPSRVFPDGDLECVTGVGKLSGRLVILVDLAKLLHGGDLRRLNSVVEPVLVTP